MQNKVINPVNNIRQSIYFGHKLTRGVSYRAISYLLTDRYCDHIELGYGCGIGCRLILCKKSITIFKV